MIENIKGCEYQVFYIRGRHFKPTKKSMKNTKTYPSLNNLLTLASTSPYKYRDTKAKFEKLTETSIRRDLQGWKTNNRVQLYFLCVEPDDGHIRDFDNVVAGVHKIIYDALKKCGTIYDDSPKYVAPSIDKVLYTKNEPYVKVMIRELNKPFVKEYVD